MLTSRIDTKGDTCGGGTRVLYLEPLHRRGRDMVSRYIASPEVIVCNARIIMRERVVR